MDKKKIKKEMKKEAEEYEIQLTAEEIVTEFNKQEKPEKKGFFERFGPILYPSTAVLAAGIALAIALPLTLGPGISGESGPITNPAIIGKYLTTEKVNRIAFEATTAFESWYEIATPTVLQRKYAISDTAKSDIKGVLPTVDLLLTNKSDFKTTLVESSLKDYPYELNIEFVDRVNEKINYNLYFNIIESKTETDDDEVESTVKYSGFMDFKTQKLPFIAIIEHETEDDGEEFEMSMILYLNDAKSSFVTIEQEKESSAKENEESFEYKVYNDNVLEREFEIETELNKDKEDVSLELGGEEYTVSVKKEETDTIFEFKDKKSADVVKFKKTLTTDPDTGDMAIAYTEV